VERSIAWLTADPTGPQRRPTTELCRQLEGQTLSIFGVSPRRWLLSAGRGPFLGCAVADCAASGLCPRTRRDHWCPLPPRRRRPWPVHCVRLPARRTPGTPVRPLLG